MMPERVFVRGIPEELWRALKAKASLEGMTVSEALRIAIGGYLTGSIARVAGTTDPWSGITAIGSSGSSDVSELHDHYLAEAGRPSPRTRAGRRR